MIAKIKTTTENWKLAALALCAGDSQKLETTCRTLPAGAGEVLRRVFATCATALPNDFALPETVEWIGDGRFVALFPRCSARIHWELPGRELVTGCYIAPNSPVEFQLESGECRFIILTG
ncbi:MAG: hypothetical protein LBM70_05570 [Victivallales bacterium]|jgi:hypothetical protein|nr:hypothetical protein [Victivallales bacterium]